MRGGSDAAVSNRFGLRFWEQVIQQEGGGRPQSRTWPGRICSLSFALGVLFYGVLGERGQGAERMTEPCHTGQKPGDPKLKKTKGNVGPVTRHFKGFAQRETSPTSAALKKEPGAPATVTGRNLSTAPREGPCLNGWHRV